MSKAKAKGPALFQVRVQLRQQGLAERKGPTRVLCYFAGGKMVWQEVQRTLPELELDVVCVDEEMEGDVRRILSRIDLDDFDVVDFDSGGIPYEPIEIFFMRPVVAPKTVFVGFVADSQTRIHDTMLEDLGYTREMLEKCRPLFDRQPAAKFFGYLWLRGVREVVRWSDDYGNKQQLFFERTPE